MKLGILSLVMASKYQKKHKYQNDLWMSLSKFCYQTASGCHSRECVLYMTSLVFYVLLPICCLKKRNIFQQNPFETDLD